MLRISDEAVRPVSKRIHLIKTKAQLFLLLLCFSLLGCAAGGRLSLPGSGEGESRRLHEIFDGYFEEYLQLFPTFATSIGDRRYDDQLTISISEEHRAKQRELYLKCLAELDLVSTETLGEQDRLNQAVFQRLLRQRFEGLTFNQHLLPVR